MLKRISSGEKEYITRGCEENIRADGRTVQDFRPIRVENSVFPHVHGSSKVCLGPSMSVVCSIRMGVIECSERNQFVDIHTKISPSTIFKSDDRKLSDFETTLSERLLGVYGNSSLYDTEKLCIISNKFQWGVTIDLVVLNMDSDPTDCCSLAIYIALKCTKIPQHCLLKGESGLYEDFEISSHLADSYLLPLKNDIPICISCHKIGSVMVMDTDCMEQACAEVGVLVALDQQEKICLVQKTIGAELTMRDLTSCLECALAIAPSIFSSIEGLSKIPEIKDNKYPDVPAKRTGMLC